MVSDSLKFNMINRFTDDRGNYGNYGVKQINFRVDIFQWLILLQRYDHDHFLFLCKNKWENGY